MDIVSIEKIDGFGGSVIPGTPVNGDLVRMTYSNGAVREKYYWEIILPEPPVVDQEVRLRGELRRTIDANTPAVIADFTYNTNTYNLTDYVIEQIRDLALILRESDSPGDYFPLDVVVGDNDGYDVVQTIPTAAAFKAVVLAVMEHIKAIREESRALKLSLDGLNLTQLQAWTDPRMP